MQNKDYYKRINLFQLVAFVLVTCFLSLHLAIIFSNEKIFIEPVSYNQNKIIILDAGHGGEDCGAIGINGVYEKDINFQITNILGDYMEKAGYTVVYTRTDDKLLYTEEQNIKGFRKIYDLKNRLSIASEYKDAYFISIHMNSFSQEQYKGLQVYYSTNNDKSELIASSIQKEVINRIQKDNKRSIKKGENIYLLENAENPAVLIECGFLSNREECKKLCEKEYQKELCFAILCGIISYESGNM